MPEPMNLFRLTERGLSAQMVRMNAAASNLANAGAVARSEDEAYRPVRAEFGAEIDRATGISSVTVKRIVTSDAAPIKHHDPDHPLADENGDVWQASINESGEMVEIMESARQYQNLVEALQTAKQLMLDTLRSK